MTPIHPHTQSHLRQPFAQAWNNVADVLPPENVTVETKIHDAQGCRNEQPLKRVGRLWFFHDMSMYVYYTPTHWRAYQPISTRTAAAG